MTLRAAPLDCATEQSRDGFSEGKANWMTKVNFATAIVERALGRNQFATLNRQAMARSFHKK